MSSPQPITLTLDRRILEHPRAYHLRRMRAGLWLYLDLLARLPAGADTFEVEPAAVGWDMAPPPPWSGNLARGIVKEARSGNFTIGPFAKTQVLTSSTKADQSERSFAESAFQPINTTLS